MTKVYFYAPSETDRKVIEEDQTQWRGHHSNFMAWVAQTYFYLKQAGFQCEITERIPEEGILIADRDTLASNYPFLDRVMLICAKSDKEYHPSAHLHIVHNFFNWQRDQNSLWNPHLISHWPIPGLIPRDTKRSNLVENIAYIGTRSQLAPELASQTWTDALTSLNCHWTPIWDKSHWNNYNNLDAVVAVRSFKPNFYLNKGFIKLINACWHAGVPAILTPESGFLGERKSDLDFLLVTSLEETIEAVRKLKSNTQLYDQILANGYQRAQEYTIQTTLTKWLSFFEDVAFPAYQEWSSLSQLAKRVLFLRRYSDFKYTRIKARFWRPDHQKGNIEDFLFKQKTLVN